MAQNQGRTFDLWNQDDCQLWTDALDSYPQVIASQGNDRLIQLDSWYREELPSLIARRDQPFIILDELQRIATWKMTRGVWRERNRQLIAQNPTGRVVEVSRQAFSATPDPVKPISLLSALSGVGPATASAVMAAYAPHVYPFFDDLVAAQIPTLGPVAFTAKYYSQYAEALRERASQLNSICKVRSWTAQDLAQTLWAASGGKSGAKLAQQDQAPS